VTEHLGQSARSHQQCIDAGEHVCQMPSGRTCIEDGCEKAAGTRWGPLWCAEHDQERMDRISGQMAEIQASFRGERSAL
jgi:hypothetical protein